MARPRASRCVFGVIVGHRHRRRHRGGWPRVTGANAIAGEWGHNPLPWPNESEWPGPSCYCGRTGCIETFLSGPGLARDFGAGEQVDAAEIVTRAAAGEVAAEQCLRRYEDRMARALASVINVLDPDVIVLGGGMSNVDRLYAERPSAVGALRVLRHGHDPAGQGGARRLERRAGCGVAVGVKTPVGFGL